MNLLSVNVCFLRKNAGLTEEQFARAVGIGSMTVKNIESGYINTLREPLAQNIASRFGVTVDMLCGKERMKVDGKSVVYVMEGVGECKDISGAVLADSVLHGEFFGYRVQDNKMSDAGIKHGGTVIVICGEEISDGDIVLIDSGGVYTAVRYNVGEEKIFFTLEYDGNKEEINSDGCNIVGKIIKYCRSV